MTRVKEGDTVTINYTARLEDDTVFESTLGQQPIDFVVGHGQILKGFEQAVIGMSPGESKSVKLMADDAYGPRRDDLVIALDRSKVGFEIEPEIGQKVNISQQNQRSIPAVVADVTDSAIIVDANHPLAGKSVKFDISVLEVV